MYESFYGFREKPFSMRPDPGYLYLGEEHSMALAVLKCGLMNEASFTVITGEIGAGKTTLIRYLLDQIKMDVSLGLISNTHRSFGELLPWMLSAFGLEYRNKEKAELYQTFVAFLANEYAYNRRTVLIIDEAQNMDADKLEELRVLSNINADKNQVLQVILVGQPELRSTLRRPDLTQFAQRITVTYHLKALTPRETDSYIQHRLNVAGGDPSLFDAMASRLVYEHSRGIPRVINSLCDTVLIYAFAEQSKTIDASLITKVVQDRKQNELFPTRRPDDEGERLNPFRNLQNGTEDGANTVNSKATLEDLRMLFGHRVNDKR